MQPESQAAYRRLFDQGWTDAIRTLHPHEPMYTFWHHMRNHWQRDAGLRLDHLLLSPTLAPRLIEAGVDRGVRGEPDASDHCPRLDYPEGRRSRPTTASSEKVPGPRRIRTVISKVRQQRYQM